MISGPLLALTLATTVGTGLFAGLFFAFSTFVMPGLAELPLAQSTTASFALSRAVYRSRLLLLAAAATAAGCGALVVVSLAGLDRAGAALRIGGASLYLFGAMGTTALYHLPQNNAVADIDPDGPGAAARWHRFLRGWTAWNHLRTLSAAVATGLLALSLR
jgi:uncharacterized membrane protein